jgi:hypothetical protein
VKRMIRVLAVAALVAMILVTSISPALAKKVAGGQLLSTDKPCDVTANSQNDRPGVDFEFFEPGNPEGRAPGCWALLPPSAAQND